VCVLALEGGVELDVRAAALSRPGRGGVEEHAADAGPALGRRHDQILQPAAPAEADGGEVGVYGGQPDDAVLCHGEQDVGVGILDGVTEAGRTPLAGVARRSPCRRIEQLLDERQRRRLVGEGGGPDGRVHACTLATAAKASSVTSSMRAISASPTAADRNQLWYGCR